MDRHLDTWLRTGALKDEVEPILHVEVRKCSCYVLLGTTELFICGLRLVCWGQAVRLLGEAIFPGEVETRLVDIDRYNARGAVGLGK